ncbi:MAG: hypothetical protein EBZ87_07025 [Microbacteriaceae bacterium]|nr:hypothetical protein [Microbacteriaceae bacterium]
MTTKNRRIEADLLTTEQPVRSDYALMQVTLTLAVETYLCDEHSEQAHEAAIEDVLERFEPLIIESEMIGSQIIVLHSEFTPLGLTKQVRS